MVHVWDEDHPFVTRPHEYCNAWIHAGIAAILPWLLLACTVWYAPRNRHARTACAWAWWLLTRVVLVCALHAYTDSTAEFAGCARSETLGRFMSRPRPAKPPKRPKKPAPRSDLYDDSRLADETADYNFMIMDSGCTTTILGDRTMFSHLEPSKARVQTADGKIIKIAYEGPAEIVVVDRHNCERRVRLPRAFYCPEMHTLLSVKQLVLLDHDVLFSKKGSRLGVDGHDVPLHELDGLYQVRYRSRARSADQLRAIAHANVAERLGPCPPPRRYVLELCAGTSSAIQFHLRDSPDAYGIAIDVRDETWMRTHIAQPDQARFTPVSMDVRHVTYDTLDKLTHKIWGVPLTRVDVIHHSPMCESLSSASRQSHTVHYSDGYAVPESDVAKYHLACLRSVFGVFRRLSDEGYTGIISAENPYSGFHRLEPVRTLAGQPGWQLVEQADHCSNTYELDLRTCPRKPTTYLLYNVLPTVDLRRCANDCPFRLPAHPEHHRDLVCNRKTKVPGQRVIHSPVDKARIPLGVFRKLFQFRSRPRPADGHSHAFSAIWR